MTQRFFIPLLILLILSTTVIAVISVKPISRPVIAENTTSQAPLQSIPKEAAPQETTPSLPMLNINKISSEKTIPNLPTPAFTPVNGCKIPIIMYHYVEYVQNKKDTLRQKLNINPDLLEKQLELLKNSGYTFHTARDIPELLKTCPTPKQKSIILTFDDGYADFYTNVFPLLKKYNSKATAYIISNRIGQQDYMTESQLKELVASGLVEIGAHTLDHPSLTRLSTPEVKRQIEESKKNLEKILNTQVETFTYPSGHFNSAIEKLTKDAGFTCALSTLAGSIHSPKTLFHLHRFRAGILGGATPSLTQLERS